MAQYQRLVIGGIVGFSSLVSAVTLIKSGTYTGKYLQVIFTVFVVLLVEPGHRAFKFNAISGVQERIYREGLNFKVPILERAIKYDIRARPQNIRCQTGSSDLQMVNIGLRIMFRPDDQKIFDIYRQLGDDYHARVLPSVVNEVLRSVVARYTANQLASNREQVSWEIRHSLQDRLRDFMIIVEDTSITELEFGRDYQVAVERKQIAEQQAQRAKFIVDRAQQEKKAKIVWAEGEAKAIRDIGSKMGSSMAYLDLKRVQMAVDIAKVLQKSRCRVFLQADTLLLNLHTPITQPTGGLLNGAQARVEAATN